MTREIGDRPADNLEVSSFLHVHRRPVMRTRGTQRPWVLLAMGLSLVTVSAAPAETGTAAPGRNAPANALRVDPLLIAEAAEVWALIASPDNPVWPGWDAASTPLLFYLPGVQDVLINHPSPPEGFLPYDGPVAFPGGRIYIRGEPTLIEWDGQNTSYDIEGTTTLVVADPLSNLRVQVSSLLLDERAADEKIQGLEFADLATDPYDQLATVAHEAFHVYQSERAPDKGANEMLLLQYPVLSVQNNVGFALEGTALAEALRARDDAAFRRGAVRWLAVRQDRRASLPPAAVEYEDGGEFTEGLAKYVEYRLFQVLEGRPSGPAMAWAQGFEGYADLTRQRESLIDQLVAHMSGAALVNNDPYGTAPLRMRLYYSGMAAGVLLDRLSPTWKERILQPEPSLTSLAEEALQPTPAELEQALAAARADTGYAALVGAKSRLAEAGRARIAAMLAAIEDGPGIALVVDYSQLGSPRLGMAFTPFGITAVDDQRTIFGQAPVAVAFGEDGQVQQTAPSPLLRDTGRQQVRFRLPSNVTRTEVAATLGATPVGCELVADLAVELPGASLTAALARVTLGERELVVVLHEAGSD